MRDLSYFSIMYLGVPHRLTEDNIKAFLFYALNEGYKIEDLITYIKELKK